MILLITYLLLFSPDKICFKRTLEPQAGNLSSKYAIHNLVQPLSTLCSSSTPNPRHVWGGGARHGTGTCPAKSRPNPPPPRGMGGAINLSPSTKPSHFSYQHPHQELKRNDCKVFTGYCLQTLNYTTR